ESARGQSRHSSQRCDGAGWHPTDWTRRWRMRLAHGRPITGGTTMKFGLIIRGQYPQGDDMQLRLREDLEAAKLAEELGYDLVAKGSHYSSHPFQYIQQIPYLCQVAMVAPK